MDEIIVKRSNSIVANLSDLQAVAQVFVKSGFFSDTADIAKAQVKILAGREIGLEPFASMNGIHVIRGKVTYGANIIASKIKSSGRYDYRVQEMTDKACRINFYERTGNNLEQIGVSEFTIDDARKAGTQNIERYPRNMLFARAISNGVKWFCPDVTSGVTMYAPEEFGAVVDDGGTVVTIDPDVAPAATSMTYEQAAKWSFRSGGTEYIVGNIADPEKLRAIIENAKDQRTVEAARIVLEHDFSMTAAAQDIAANAPATYVPTEAIGSTAEGDEFPF